MKDNLDEEERNLYRSAGVDVPQELNASELELLKCVAARGREDSKYPYIYTFICFVDDGNKHVEENEEDKEDKGDKVNRTKHAVGGLNGCKADVAKDDTKQGVAVYLCGG